jgi:cyclic pyranopterin phosphate synthase
MARARNLTHLDARGAARMVDVGSKDVSLREAIAEAVVRMLPATLKTLRDERAPKGDVLAAVRLAAIGGAKRTSELIPLCHAIAIDTVIVDVELGAKDTVRIRAHARTHAQTGVEMEALTAASVGALTLYDMLKSLDRGMVIERVRLLEKHGGASGDFVRDERPTPKPRHRARR